MNSSMHAAVGTRHLPQIAAAYVQAINDHDAAAFIACFTETAVVQDAGRTFRGMPAIKAWSDREIFDARVTLEVMDVADRNGEVTIKTKVDGNFDRTGLPDPVVIDHHITVQGDKIVRLACRLTGEEPGTL